MPSPLGFLAREKTERTINLAKWMGVLHPTLELTESGYLISHLLALSRDTDGQADETFNILNPRCHPCLPLIYFRLLLTSEVLFPFLVIELTTTVDRGDKPATRGSDGLLLRAIDRLFEFVGDIRDPDDALAIREVDSFREAVRKSDSTAENYLRPRLEILVDLGFLARREGGTDGRSDFLWEVSSATRLLSEELQRAISGGTDLPGATNEYLDRRYFQSMATVLSLPLRAVDGDRERMLWLARAFKAIGREFGFTPGRTLALKAAVMAWESGAVVEIGDLFDATYRAAKSSLERHLHFSGGSRFDREFLIRIDPEIVPVLEAKLAETDTSL
jgi:hypothetical protein